MAYQEKRLILNIIWNILIVATYCIYVFWQFQERGPALAYDLSFWGATILIFVGVSIAARIVMEIILAIGNAIVTRTEEDPSFTDERDKLIELRGARISEYTVGFGFLIALGTLVLKMPPYVMLNILFFSFLLGDILRTILQLHDYRRGF
jgi:hypothetical protein